MKHVSIIVRAVWDEEAHVWVATSNEVAGLAVEAETVEALRDKVLAAIGDLAELNGLDDMQDGLPDIPRRLGAETLKTLRHSR